VTNHEGLWRSGGVAPLIPRHCIESLASKPGRSLWRKELPVPNVQAAVWNPKPLGTLENRKVCFPSPEIKPRIVQAEA